jgi:glycosyltransferase involved in cell wall biosynthesis
MHIAAFSINPLFPGTVMGGAPKHLQNIATHLGSLGHRVTVLCTRPPGGGDPFSWGENVTVVPSLPFKQPFPQPYAVSGPDLARIVQETGDLLATADRFYMHDGELLFPFVYRDVPTVVSLRDNVYPETLHGSYLFGGSTLVLISEYSRRFVEATAGRFFPTLHERIQVIHNGIDWTRFKPTAADGILDFLPFDPAHHTVILHPHRPEESKGLMQMLDVVEQLVHGYGHRQIKALAPRWLDVQDTAELTGFYRRVERTIEVRGLTEHVVFHDWIPQRLMPEYFSLGTVTFSLGHFAETFGNAVYESLGCGTPSIAARVTTHRELLPPHLIDTVDFDDADAAAAIADEIIRTKRRTSAETLAYLYEHYGIERQLSQYADVILNAQPAEPPAYRHPTRDESTLHVLAPWCYRSARGIYHDFRADYADPGTLGELLRANPDGVSRTLAVQRGIDGDEFERWYEDGYIVPRSTVEQSR